MLGRPLGIAGIFLAFACAHSAESLGDTPFSEPLEPMLPGQTHEDPKPLPTDTSGAPDEIPNDGERGMPEAGTQVAAGTATAPAVGDLVLSEIMFDPSGAEPDGEWFELASRAAGPRTIDGLTIKDGASRTHTIRSTRVIRPGEHLVFVRARATAKVPAATVAYEYGEALPASEGVSLGNGATGSLALYNKATLLTSAPYGNLALGGMGRTIQRRRLDASDALASSWCASTTRWASASDYGTPGAASDCM